jgi:hypothetical protein
MLESREMRSLRLPFAAALLLAIAVACGSTEATNRLTAPASGKPPELRTGETDRDSAYHPGAVRIRLALGADITSVVRKHGLASASPLFPSPYSVGALAAGFERAYRVTVPVGEEKQVVKRLAPFVSDFEFVGLDYIDDVKQG